MKPASIFVLGLFGQGNLGNESHLQALLENTRRYLPDATVTAICSRPEDTTTRHRVPAIPISRRHLRSDRHGVPVTVRPSTWLRRARGIARETLDWLSAIRTLAGKDMLIVSGALLTDFSGSVFDFPYDVFRWSLAAKLCRCKLVFVSVGAGPIYRPRNRWLVRSALSLADYRSYRESSTVDYLETLGFRRQSDRVVPDVAFSLQGALDSEATVPSAARRVVGIGLMSDPGKLRAEKPSRAVHVAYLEKLTHFARWLLDHEYDVRLLIGDFEYDAAVAREFADTLRRGLEHAEGRVIATPASSVEELVSQIAATDVVVATRFHNVLLALALNKPTMAISFHHKCVSLMRAMGLSEYLQDIAELDVDRLVAQLRELERDAPRLKASIKRNADECRNVLDEQYRVIFNDLDAEAQNVARSSPSPVS